MFEQVSCQRGLRKSAFNANAVAPVKTNRQPPKRFSVKQNETGGIPINFKAGPFRCTVCGLCNAFAEITLNALQAG